MDEENKKINVDSFFDRISSVGDVANSALTKVNNNLGIINNQRALIESLSVSIETIQTQVRDIANYIIVDRKLEKDLEEDRRLEAEDAEQKREMSEKVAAMGEQGPQGEQGPAAQPQAGGGGGGFLGGIISALVKGGTLLAMVPTIAPMLLTKFVIPKISEGLKFVFDKGMSWLGKNISGVFDPATYAPLGIGKFFKGIKQGIESKFEGASSKFGELINSIFKGGSGGSSDSNMGVTDSTVENGMDDTLTEEGLIDKENKQESFEESLENADQASAEVLDEQKKGQDRMQKVNDAYFNLQEGKITQEQYNKIEDAKSQFKEGTITGEEFDKILKENSKGDKEVDKEVDKEGSNGDEKKFNVIEGEQDMTIEKLEREIAVHETKIEKMREEGKNTEIIEMERDKMEMKRQTLLDMKSGLPVDAKTKFRFVEPVKGNNGIDLSINENSESIDELTNVVTNQSEVNNNPQNNDVVVQANKPQVSIASIKKTTSNIPFVKLSKNQYLSINESELPPEVARMIT